jgi:MFS family permease
MVMYGASAVGLAPYSLFWVDFIARSLHDGIAAGGRDWAMFGVSAALGPLAAGLIADRAGFRPSLRWCLLMEGICAALPLVSTLPLALAVTSIGVGGLGIGGTSLASGRTLEITPPAHQKQAWGWMTAVFSISYAGAGGLLSFLFARTGSHLLLFLIGAAALCAGGLVDLFLPALPVETTVPQISDMV